MALEFEYIIKPIEGRRIVVGDIHGCNQTFNALLWNQVELTHNDQLFLLGDFVDRGPDSKGVLDTIRKLVKNDFIVFPLRGNHENTLLEYNKEDFRFLKWHLRKNNQLNLLKGEKIKRKYKKLIKNLPYYYILNDFYLVHAGFDIKSGNPFENKVAMTEIRNMQYDALLFENKTIVYGHQPTPLSKIQKSAIERWPLICIDNGAVYKGKKKKYMATNELGNLVAIDLDTFQLYIQPNIE
jgi:serine/threonine protein phosphatase 1